MLQRISHVVLTSVPKNSAPKLLGTRQCIWMKRSTIFQDGIRFFSGNDASNNSPIPLYWSELHKIRETDSDYVIIDVRERAEIAEGKLDKNDWTNVPMWSVMQTSSKDELTKNVNELNQCDKIYLLCRAGKRSEAVGKHMINIGFDPNSIYNIEGGMIEYFQTKPKQ